MDLYCEADGVFIRVQKIVYHSVILHSDAAARCFIASLEHRPQFAASAVRTLHMGVAVRNNNAAKILNLCKGITDLTLRVVCHHILTKNPVIEPLEALPLTSLSADLSAIFHDRRSYLPNLQIVHRITHLHLTNAWACWEGIPIGLPRLIQLTHLSVPWNASRSDINLLHEIMKSTNLKVVVLWRSESEKHNALVECLRRGGLKDRRIVCFCSAQYLYYYSIHGGFWGYAENLVKWREEVEGMSVGSPLQCSTLLNKMYQPIRLRVLLTWGCLL